MSRLVSCSFLFVSLLTVSLPHARALAQDSSRDPGSTLAGAAIATATGAEPAPVGKPTPRPAELGFAVVARLGADLGVLSDGDDDRHRPGEGIQAFGALHLFVGHDVWAEGDVSVALGYEGSVGYGSWNLLSDGSAEAIVTRQGIAGAFRGGFLGLTLGGAASWAIDPSDGASILGGSLLAEIAIVAGPVWIGVPIGVDIWPDLGLHTQTFGLNVGLTTM